MRIVPSTIARTSTPHHFRTIVRLTTFERTAPRLLADEDQAALDYLLARQPDSGPLIRGAGGLRKLRVRSPGGGKRGGVRVIYYYHGAKERVYLILAYAKSVKDDLRGREKQQLRKLTAVLEAEP